LTKRVYLNLFRHSEATVTANFMTEAQLRKRHGWTAESKMPARYVHLVNADVDEAIFEHYGIKKKEDQLKEKIPKICKICEVANSSESIICSKCGKPLDLETAIEIEEKDKVEKNKLEEEVKDLQQKQKELEKKIVDPDEIISKFIEEMVDKLPS